MDPLDPSTNPDLEGALDLDADADSEAEAEARDRRLDAVGDSYPLVQPEEEWEPNELGEEEGDQDARTSESESLRDGEQVLRDAQREDRRNDGVFQSHPQSQAQPTPQHRASTQWDHVVVLSDTDSEGDEPPPPPQPQPQARKRSPEYAPQPPAWGEYGSEESEEEEEDEGEYDDEEGYDGQEQESPQEGIGMYSSHYAHAPEHAPVGYEGQHVAPTEPYGQELYYAPFDTTAPRFGYEDQFAFDHLHGWPSSNSNQAVQPPAPTPAPVPTTSFDLPPAPAPAPDGFGSEPSGFGAGGIDPILVAMAAAAAQDARLPEPVPQQQEGQQLDPALLSGTNAEALPERVSLATLERGLQPVAAAEAEAGQQAQTPLESKSVQDVDSSHHVPQPAVFPGSGSVSSVAQEVPQASTTLPDAPATSDPQPDAAPAKYGEEVHGFEAKDAPSVPDSATAASEQVPDTEQARPVPGIEQSMAIPEVSPAVESQDGRGAPEAEQAKDAEPKLAVASAPASVSASAPADELKPDVSVSEKLVTDVPVAQPVDEHSTAQDPSSKPSSGEVRADQTADQLPTGAPAPEPPKVKWSAVPDYTEKSQAPAMHPHPVSVIRASSQASSEPAVQDVSILEVTEQLKVATQPIEPESRQDAPPAAVDSLSNPAAEKEQTDPDPSLTQDVPMLQVTEQVVITQHEQPEPRDVTRAPPADALTEHAPPAEQASATNDAVDVQPHFAPAPVEPQPKQEPASEPVAEAATEEAAPNRGPEPVLDQEDEPQQGPGQRQEQAPEQGLAPEPVADPKSAPEPLPDPEPSTNLTVPAVSEPTKVPKSPTVDPVEAEAPTPQGAADAPMPEKAATDASKPDAATEEPKPESDHEEEDEVENESEPQSESEPEQSEHPSEEEQFAEDPAEERWRREQNGEHFHVRSWHSSGEFTNDSDAVWKAYDPEAEKTPSPRAWHSGGEFTENEEEQEEVEKEVSEQEKQEEEVSPDEEQAEDEEEEAADAPPADPRGRPGPTEVIELLSSDSDSDSDADDEDELSDEDDDEEEAQQNEPILSLGSHRTSQQPASNREPSSNAPQGGADDDQKQPSGDEGFPAA